MSAVPRHWNRDGPDSRVREKIATFWYFVRDEVSNGIPCSLETLSKSKPMAIAVSKPWDLSCSRVWFRPHVNESSTLVAWFPKPSRDRGSWARRSRDPRTPKGPGRERDPYDATHWSARGAKSCCARGSVKPQITTHQLAWQHMDMVAHQLAAHGWLFARYEF